KSPRKASATVMANPSRSATLIQTKLILKSPRVSFNARWYYYSACVFSGIYSRIEKPESCHEANFIASPASIILPLSLKYP
ncbi:MAG: hypothetical protein ABSA13_17360, partial [Beijerinckiaceae bacterium]